ncbi:MAG: carboxypeptidase-like regulatory domain-containing protein [Cytophagales bacterium]|nr:carboxypeptidase-like regulatory domain-containing protein [Cytophagales bacterium]
MTVRIILLILFITFILDGFSQRKMITGRVVDQVEKEIPSVHIRNLTIGKITVSNESGNFKMPANEGDTLRLTSVGFEELIAIVSYDWFERATELVMIEGTIELEELTISSIPSIEEFKERVLQYKPVDSTQFWYFGVDKPVLTGDKMVVTNKYKSPLFAIFHPASFMYYNFSKQEKEKRKIYSITKTQPVRDRAYNKFTRDWVREETGLEGDQLTSFIAFCDFDIYYLDRTSLFIIKENMMAKLEEFREEGKG